MTDYPENGRPQSLPEALPDKVERPGTDGIGYGRPPKHSRWKKGQSGNPRGRAKGEINLKTDLLAELGEVVQITEAGAQRGITKQRALLKSLTARAIGGDGRAASLILNLVMRVIDPGDQLSTDGPLTAEDEALLDAFMARRQVPKGGKS